MARHLQKRAAEVMAAFIAIGALLLFLALVSWNASDPSFTTETSRRPTNFLGAPGAAAADILMQFIGMASAALLVIMIAWATELWTSKHLARMNARLAAAALSVYLLAGALSSIQAVGYWPLTTGLGGAMGESQAVFIGYFLGSIGVPRASVVASLLLLAISLRSMSYATDLTFDSMWAALDRSGGAASPRPATPPAAINGMAAAATATRNPDHPPHQSEDARRDQNPRPTMDVPAQGSEITTAAAKSKAYPVEPTLAFPSRELAEPSSIPAPAGPVATAADTEEAATAELALPKVFRREQDTRADIKANAPAASQATEDARRSAHSGPRNPEPHARAVAHRDTVSVAHVIRSLREEELRDEQAANRSPSGAVPPAASASRPLADPSWLTREGQSDLGATKTEPLARQALERLIDTLTALGIEATVLETYAGPVSQVAFVSVPAHTSFERVYNLRRDIVDEARVPGLEIFRDDDPCRLIFELPHPVPVQVALAEIAAQPTFRMTPAPIPLVVGKSAAGELVLENLVAHRHALIVGNGSAAVQAHVRAVTLAPLFRVDGSSLELRLIDAGTEDRSALAAFAQLPQLEVPAAFGLDASFPALAALAQCVDDRQRAMAAIAVHDFESFNARMRQSARREKILGRPVHAEATLSPMPRILAVIGNLHCMLAAAPQDVTAALVHILDYGPDCGVHVLAELSATTDLTVAQELRDRFGARVAFRQATAAASLQGLGTYGAERLVREQDALLVLRGEPALRVHVVQVSHDDAVNVVGRLHAMSEERPQKAPTIPAMPQAQEKSPTDGDDALYERAINIVLRDRRAYSGHLARSLGIDRPMAVALIDRMVDDGIVSPPDEGGNQRVLLERRATVVRV